jgi:predicted ribosome quality control (RQC) complex YloA/Tae2 family protein
MKTETVFFPNIQKLIEFRIGKNAQDNFDIIDAADPDDLWFHVENQASCHVIANIANEDLNKKAIQTIIKRGALICKQNSTFKSVKNLSIIYTKIKNVQKTDTVGSVILESSKTIQV